MHECMLTLVTVSVGRWQARQLDKLNLKPCIVGFMSVCVWFFSVYTYMYICNYCFAWCMPEEEDEINVPL